MAMRLPGLRTCKQKEKAKQWLWFFGLYLTAVVGLGLFSLVAHVIFPHA